MALAMSQPSGDNEPPTLTLKQGRQMLANGSAMTAAEARALAKEAFNREADCVAARDFLERITERTSMEAALDKLLEARIEAQTGHYDHARNICHNLLKCHAFTSLPPKNLMDARCLIARTYKDEWIDGEEAALEYAAKGYADAADRMPDQHFPAINAATMYRQLGDCPRSQKYASRARQICLAEIESAKRNGEEVHYWTYASLAEAEGLIGSESDARRNYKLAADMAWDEGNLRDVASMRRQARWIDDKIFDSCFNLPDVLFYAGHMIDPMERVDPRFHASCIDKVRAALKAHFSQIGPVLAFGSAACGADLLIAEAILARQNEQRTRRGPVDELHLMLSGPRDTFVRDSVRVGPPDAHELWETLFTRATKAAVKLQYASPHAPAPGSVAYHYANQFLIGEGLMKAKTLDLDKRALVIWDKMEWGNGSGGTSDVVQLLRQQGIEPVVINPVRFAAGIKLQETGKSAKRKRQHHSPSAHQHDVQEIMAFLFADTVNFSHLTETQVPKYFRAFMGKISRLISHSDYAPCVVNTWGDALYMIFDDVRAAGQFALDLRDELDPVKANWVSEELPAELNIRLALHVGPAFFVTDPITRTISYTGRHVTYAARMEPVVPAGEVNASPAFAAFAAIEDNKVRHSTTPHLPLAFRYQYRGQVQLAKQYGKATGIYRLARRNQSPSG